MESFLRLLGVGRDRRLGRDPRTQSTLRGASSAPAYPSVDPGLPVVPVDAILDQNRELISRIKLSYGSDAHTFGEDVLPLIRRYGDFVHLLPATSDNYFCSPGGLFRLGLEIAFFSLQATDGQIFSGRATIRVRRHLEPRWRKATFIAGLCHEIHRTLSHLVVTDTQGNEWPSYMVSLDKWLKSIKADRYFLKWIPNAGEMRSLGVFALHQVVDSQTLQNLARGNSVVVPQLMGSISGMPTQRDNSVLDQLVRRAAALVIDRDLRASADRYGKPILGSHLERYLVDGMRRLVADSETWKPNSDRSRVWFGLDGTFIVWPNAAADLSKLLESDQLPGIPKASETILEILVAAGVALPQSENRATWDIFPPNTKKPIEAIRLSFPEILFAGSTALPQRIERHLLVPQSVPAEEKKPFATPSSRPATSQLSDGPSGVGQIALDLGSGAHDGAGRGSPDTCVEEDEERVEQLAAAPEHKAADPASPASPTHPQFGLAAPFRLNPAVRQALENIVQTLNGTPSDVAARTVAHGVFIPLKAFELRKVDPAIAVRSLAEVEMLVLRPDTSAKTVVQDFGGEELPGVVISPAFVSGLSIGDFAPASAAKVP